MIWIGRKITTAWRIVVKEFGQGLGECELATDIPRAAHETINKCGLIVRRNAAARDRVLIGNRGLVVVEPKDVGSGGEVKHAALVAAVGTVAKRGNDRSRIRDHSSRGRRVRWFCVATLFRSGGYRRQSHIAARALCEID